MMRKRRLFVIGDYIEVRSKNEANRKELIALLQRIPGDSSFF